jgi:hypothetical protein
MRNLTAATLAVCGLLGPVSLLTGCGPKNGALASPPLGVTYKTGDMRNTINGQMGLTTRGPSAGVEGGLGFAGPAEVSCGPDAGVFRLRFRPEGTSAPVLTLRIPEAGPGGDREGDPEHRGGEGPSEEGPEARLLRVEHGRVEELTGAARVSMHSVGHVAGRHAVSGTFTAELDGTTLDGHFARCFYFPG